MKSKLPTLAPLEETLRQRAAIHGRYEDYARVAHEMKQAIGRAIDNRALQKQVPLTAVQHQSLDMIVHKIARILAGMPMEEDNWNDIALYAILGSGKEAE